ncbi:hypothetical protein N182_30005 [Sinorhizobium sp. GL2]|nr:hypothetical protein N182_30005 [Sinorhizobium sp. GL2]
MYSARKTLIAFRTTEIGEHIVVSPPKAAVRIPPAIEILRISTDVYLRVDGTAAADYAGLCIR